MARKPEGQDPQDNKAAVQLSRQLSNLIIHLYRSRGMKQEEFARAIGYTRSSLCQILHADETARLWRLPAICAVARVLNTTPAELLTTASAWGRGTDDRLASLCLLTLGTDSGSDERFSIVVKDAAEGMEAKGDLDKDCSAEYAAIGAPRTLEAYRSLRMSDEELFQLTQDAIADHPKLPVWAALGKYEQEGDTE